MKLNIFSKSNNQITFYDNSSKIFPPKELIIVDLKASTKEVAFKQEMKAEFFLSRLGEELSWFQIDQEMARINSLKLHFV